MLLDTDDGEPGFGETLRHLFPARPEPDDDDVDFLRLRGHDGRS